MRARIVLSLFVLASVITAARPGALAGPSPSPSPSPSPTGAPTQCSDGIDNDGDGDVDYDGGSSGHGPDTDCDNPNDDVESNGRTALQCSDGIDNDGDGTIDFEGGPNGEGADPGCDSPEDDNEFEIPGCRRLGGRVSTTCIDHHRVVRVTDTRHVRRDGKRVLEIRGTVETPDGTTSCSSGVPMKVQRLEGGKWMTIREPRTSYSDRDGDGRYGLRATVADSRGEYRILAPRHMIAESPELLTPCLKDVARFGHQH
jgi:hypothetical protein